MSHTALQNADGAHHAPEAAAGLDHPRVAGRAPSPDVGRPGRRRPRAWCAACANGIVRFATHCRDSSVAAATVASAVAMVLLIIAICLDPSGLADRGAARGGHHLLYLAAGVVGSMWIWWSALRRIRAHDFTAEPPVAIATVVGLAIGQYATTAAVAVLLVVGGVVQEHIAARTGKAVETLGSLLPNVVTVRRDDREHPVALTEVVIGDVVVVRAGERIPVDGEIVIGNGVLDESVITGDSRTVERHGGESVLAGALLQSGTIRVRVTRVGGHTALRRIRQRFADAESSKAVIETRLARHATLCTPAALVLGLLLWALTADVMRGITMLIVFCPGVMLLATRTALVAAVRNAASHGALITPRSIDVLARAGTIVFDKTGTLTHGTPSLSRAIPAFRHTRERLLSYAASAEYFSDHPLARAIEHAAFDAGVQIAEPDEFAAAAGLGVRTRIYGHEVIVGRAAYFRELGLDALLPSIEGWPDQPGTRVHVARDRHLLGSLVFNDVVRDQACDTVDALQALGLRTIIVSGDNRRVTRSLAAQLGIYTAHANLMPADKVRVVTYLQATGGTVAFVGGGVGDRPALAAADIGITVVRPGPDFTLENAEIGLLGGDLSELPHLVSLSRWALRVMRQNLAFCLGALAAAIGFTFTGLLGPISGALLGQLSAVAVIANSGRVKRLRVIETR